jgi:dTDP-4-amino-4,6-dideoxygalactose transaminase
LQPLLVSRAATGIYLLSKVLGLNGKSVLVPTITCASPINSLIFTGAKPIFVDINLDDFTMNIDAIENSIEMDTKAILLIDIFGHRINREKIYEVADKHNLYVIEDLAQSSLSYINSKDNSYTKYAVVSFGDRKPIDSSLGGAILLKDNRYRESLLNEYNKLSKLTEMEQKRLYENYRADYYSLINKEAKVNEMDNLKYKYKNMFIFHLDWDNLRLNKLYSSLEDIPKNIDLRIKNSDKLYRELSQIEYIKTPTYDNDTVCYRYSFLMQKNRDKYINLIRKNNLHVSTLYPDVRMLNKNDLKNTKTVANSIVNLWVDATVDSSYFNQVLNILKEEQ